MLSSNHRFEHWTWWVTRHYTAWKRQGVISLSMPSWGFLPNKCALDHNPDQQQVQGSCSSEINSLHNRAGVIWHSGWPTCWDESTTVASMLQEQQEQHIQLAWSFSTTSWHCHKALSGAGLVSQNIVAAEMGLAHHSSFSGISPGALSWRAAAGGTEYGSYNHEEAGHWVNREFRTPWSQPWLLHKFTGSTAWLRAQSKPIF